ncbi:MAG: hypothetical protein LLF76_09435 [Planctomycetaceae bacterium]|nr:hypothetical protein [Planctomycetaceae bacterium]
MRSLLFQCVRVTLAICLCTNCLLVTALPETSEKGTSAPSLCSITRDSHLLADVQQPFKSRGKFQPIKGFWPDEASLLACGSLGQLQFGSTLPDVQNGLLTSCTLYALGCELTI